MDTEQETLGFLQKFESRIMLGLLLFAVFAILVAMSMYVYSFGSLPIETKPDQWGPFGDYFGGVLNPIFSFLAFLILMMSFRLQAQELRETRVELTAARTAQEQASKAQMQQAKLANQQIQQINIQNYENLFFRLLELKQLAWSSIKDIRKEAFYERRVDVKSKQQFENWPASEFKMNTIDSYLESSKLWSENKALNFLIESFNESTINDFLELDEEILPFFQGYLQLTHQILLFLNSSEPEDGIPSVKKAEYIQIYRSSLIELELQIIFYSGVSPKIGYIGPQFKAMIEESHILKFLILQKSDKFLHIKNQYQRSAFL